MWRQTRRNKYAAVKDSDAYFYAGYANDIKNVFSKLNVSYQALP
jgi:hypothetical protein